MEMVIQEAKKNLAHTDMLFTLIQLLGVCVEGVFYSGTSGNHQKRQAGYR